MPSLTRLLVLLATTVFAAPQALADDTATTMLVIDGSGSMWARYETDADKRAKIDVLRELLKPIVAGAGSNRIGLLSFGHRRKGDCGDVEVIAAPDTDHTTVLAPLEKLNPKGKGPLAEGLRQAAAAIAATRPASILAVTDGADNCRQDACAAAAEIAKSSPNVAIHVVAIGVEAIDLPRLQCVAKETGGKFYDTRDPIALAAAVTEAAALAMTHTPSAPGPSSSDASVPTPAQLAGASLHAALHLSPNAPPLNMPAEWRIVKSGSQDPPRHIEAAEIAENLPPGTYDIEARVADLSAKSKVTITEGKPEDVALSLNAARLKVSVKRRETQQAASAPLITIATRGGEANGNTVWIGRKDQIDMLLAPAAYTVSVADGQTRQEREVALELGTEQAAEFALGTGRIALSAVEREGGEALADVTFSIFIDDPESPEGRREMFRSRAPQPDFTLPPGTYYVAATTGNAEVRQRVALNTGDDLKKVLVLPAAHLKVSAQVCTGAPPEDLGLVYRIYSFDGANPRQIARTTRPHYEDTLNAGKYRIVAALDTQAVYAVQDIALEVGKPAEVTLKIDCGEITFKPPALANTIVPGEAFWEVKDASGKALWHASSPEPKVLLAPGRYTVRMAVRDHASEAAFEVRSGERKQIELGAK